MRKAALVYNPASGGSKQRQSDLEAALAVLQQAGVEADLVPTQSPEHAIEETRRSIDSGCDTIFACGGDGTIHNLIQVLANSPAALAVLPLGTANALAHDAHGNVFIGTDKGLWCVGECPPEVIDRARGLLDDKVDDLAVDGRNRVWVLTEKGINIVEP